MRFVTYSLYRAGLIMRAVKELSKYKQCYIVKYCIHVYDVNSWNWIQIVGMNTINRMFMYVDYHYIW
jgi:hypothetical protein